MAKREIKKKVEEKKVGKSRGLFIGLIGFIVFVVCFLIVIYELVEELIFFFGFLLMVILTIIGLIVSIIDYRKGKKLSLAGILVNVIFLILVVPIILSFIIPWMEPPSPPKCFDAISSIEIDTFSQFTCYYIENGHAVFNVSVNRSSTSVDIPQFTITAYGDGRSERFEIKNGTTSTEQIKMFGSPVGNPIEVPGRREMKTYSLKTDNLTEIISAELAPVIKGNIYCDAADKPKIEMCS